MKNEMKKIGFVIAVATFSSVVSAGMNTDDDGLIEGSTWNGWTTFQNNPNEDGRLDPGYGGQAFDAEFLLYKLEGNNLSIGLQTGFDVLDGHLLYGGKNYWAGDLFLSFDTDADYEFSVDFGLDTCGYSARNTGACGADLNHAAGVYEIGAESDAINNDVYYTSANPFAMKSGVLAAGLSENMAGYDSEKNTFFRQITFDIADLGIGDITGFDAHWVMSCGNDPIDGGVTGITTSVPEPSTFGLLGLGLAGLGFLRKKA
jgi:PEP-CTERM motif